MTLDEYKEMHRIEEDEESEYEDEADSVQADDICPD
jgi:hypothetical protein